MTSREEVSIRQHRNRLLQLAESSVGSKASASASASASAASKHRSFATSPRNGSASKSLLTQEPSYTPNIEHLVFPDRRNSNPGGGKSPLHSPMSGALPNGSKHPKSRSRLAEVFALSRHQQKIGSTSVDSGLKLNGPGRKNGGGGPGPLSGGGGDSVGRGHQPCVGRWATGFEEPVHESPRQPPQPPQPPQPQQEKKGQPRASPSPEGGQCWSQHSTQRTDKDGMATTRGSNVSILHLRSTSEPWDALTTPSYGVGVPKNGRPTSSSSRNGSNTSIPTLQVKYSGNPHYNAGNYANNGGHYGNNGGNYGNNGGNYSNNGVTFTSNNGPRNGMSGYASLQYGRRRDPAGPAALFLADGNGGSSSGNGGSCQRELSPVRWCDREVDGVYLGRSGWVQVQQRSLDENRRGIYQVPVTSTPTESPVLTKVKSGTLPTRRPGVKLADYHCNSEPGHFPEAVKVEDQQRPAYLPLPPQFSREYEHRVSSRSTSPSPLDNGPMSPPSITPIISPPPAFQDCTRRYGTAPRTRAPSGKPPFLPRSNAVDSDVTSPPPSPPPAINWSSLPTSTSRFRRLTPSPVATPSLRLPQTKSLEDTSARRTQFQKYDSSSSSSSSFGFRSLDSSLTARVGVAMPRLSETDSSIGGYEDGDEDDRDSSLNLSGFSSLTVVNSPPDLPAGLQPRERVANGDKVSPSSLRHNRPARSSHQSRRSPGSDGSHKKLASNDSSSSSSSSSGCGRTPTRRASNHTGAKLRVEAAHGYHTWDGRHRVRRSRSLQLPEPGKSPSPGSREPAEYAGSHLHYSQQATEPHRVVVKIGQEQAVRRPYMTHRKTHSEDGIRKEGIRWEAQDEVRAVTEYLYGTRSRAAARALLMHRYHERPELAAPSPEELRKAPEGGFNVFFVPRGGGSNGAGKVKQHVLSRGATTPTSSSHGFSPSPDAHRCSPNSCDFWPHCSAHRGDRPNQYSPQNPTKSPSPPNNMRQSQSYPTTQNRVNGARAPYPEKCPDSRRSSPASLDRVDEYGCPLERNGSQNSQMPRRFDRLKIGLDTSSSASSSMDQEPKGFNKVLQRQISPGLPKSVEDEFDRPSSSCKERRSSPSAASIILPPSGTSSNSSSSSDVWVTTSDRTLTKSLRTLKSSGTSTPLDDVAAPKSPARIGGDVQRPGSAPAEVDDDGYRVLLDAHQRSLSLPKSFLSEQRALFANSRQSGAAAAAAFPWRRPTGVPCATPGSPLPEVRLPSPASVSHTAPATPVKEVHILSDSQYRRSPGLSKSVRRGKSSNFPLDETATSRSDWDIRRSPWPVGTHADGPSAAASSTFLAEPQSASSSLRPGLVDNDKVLSQSQRSILGNTSSSESVLQKFRKTFALKFQKKSGSREEDGGMEDAFSHNSDPHLHPSPPSTLKDDSSSDPRFKFGPLIWRSSKERKKTKKAARNAKCNSGDSGIQIEMVPGSLHVGGDSSESHDTDHQMDDEMDSPPVVRRRTAADKLMRPQSELINQILIDKFKADLQTRSQSRPSHVRRTHSDLGGQRLFNWDVRNSYRRMFSSPSPIKMRPSRVSPPPRPADSSLLRGTRLHTGRAQLRRSMSQPLGINELSPLMRRKPRALLASDDDRGGTSDDDAMSDSESSVISATDRKKSFEDELVILAEAVWDHVAMETEELAFRAGDVIEVLDTMDRDWWWGTRGDASGWFPAAFVRLRVSQEETVEDCLAAMASGSTSSSQLRRRASISLLSNDQVRSSVVRELVNTERDFVKILRDVSEGYLAECLRRKDMFTKDQIQTIFGNVEELLIFQSAFLEDLERRIDWEAPHRSCIGQCFLIHRAGFRIYSEYCNSHPLATATLQELYQRSNYGQFFEACRLMRGLMEIPLDGYLLTPVQRICKYPLQLAELLKYTKADHPDYAKIGEALEAMRGVAVLVNERKRRMESLEKLVAWQMRVEGWEDEDLIEASSQLIHQGEVVRVTSGMWTTNVTLFLFDHQLVYCKKDILKRNTHVYKGRIHLDTSEVINVPDGKDPQLGAAVRHGLKVYSCVRDKWLLFCCRSPEEKQQWLDAFAEERRMVAQDRRDGLFFPPAARQLAQTAARCQRRPPSKPRKKAYKRDSGYSAVPPDSHRQGPGSTNSLGRKVGTWFTFGGNKKARSLSHHHP